MGDLLFVTPQCHCGFTGAYLANSYIKFLETRAEYNHSSRIKTVLSATCLPAFAGSRCQGCNSCNAITLNWKISIFDASLGQLIDKLKVKLTPHWVSVLVRPDKLLFSEKQHLITGLTNITSWLGSSWKPALTKESSFQDHTTKPDSLLRRENTKYYPA